MPNTTFTGKKAADRITPEETAGAYRQVQREFERTLDRAQRRVADDNAEALKKLKGEHDERLAQEMQSAVEDMLKDAGISVDETGMVTKAGRIEYGEVQNVRGRPIQDVTVVIFED